MVVDWQCCFFGLGTTLEGLVSQEFGVLFESECRGCTWVSNGVPQSKSLLINFLLLGDDLFESTIPNRQWSSLFCEVRLFVVTFGGCATFVCLAKIS